RPPGRAARVVARVPDRIAGRSERRAERCGQRRAVARARRRRLAGARRQVRTLLELQRGGGTRCNTSRIVRALPARRADAARRLAGIRMTPADSTAVAVERRRGDDSGATMSKASFVAMVAGAVIVLDQLTKWYVRQTIPVYETIPVINGFFSIIHARNPGGAFSLFAGAN